MSRIITLDGARTAPAINTSLELDAADLLGHTLQLNTTVANYFHCGGFSVSRHNPTGTVTMMSQISAIRQALKEGKLLDVTGQDIRKGFRGRMGSTKGIESSDTGKRVYIGQDARGNTYVVTPKNKKDQERIERSIKRTGTVPGKYIKAIDSEFSGIVGGIQERDHDDNKPLLYLADADGNEVGTVGKKPARKKPASKAAKKAAPRSKATANKATSAKKKAAKKTR